MRVAVVGANLLGSATAFYVRRALDANRADAAASAAAESEQERPASGADAGAAPKPAPADEIVVFEQAPRAGGNKFATLSLGDVEVPAGTMSGVDVAAAPVLSTLLADAKVPLPPRRPRREWAVFDWDKDEYKVAQVHSRFCAAVLRSPVLSALIQIFALVSALFFGKLFREKGLKDAFVAIDNDDEKYVEMLLVVWFGATVLLGCGVLPMRWVMRAYDWLFFANAVSITSGMTYGGHSISVVAQLMAQIREHLQFVVEQDSATSCVTAGHLLSACGLAKYAKVSVPEFIGKFQIQQNVLDDCVAPGLIQTYNNSACAADNNTSALALLLNMLIRCPMPTSFRSRARYFNTAETKALCPQLLKAADAQLKLGVEVKSVVKISKTQYELSGTYSNSSDGKKVSSLGRFDAVVLAAVVDPSRFSTDAIDLPLDQFLSLDPALSGLPPGEVQILNTAKYASLVKGELNPGYFRKSYASSVATHVAVLNSVNCSKILRVGEDVYRVTSGEKPEKGSSLLTTVFKDASEIASLERVKRRYYPGPLRNVNGAEAPAFIMGTRFLNAACVDRVANDPNLDCLAARNAASFLRDGVATWK